MSIPARANLIWENNPDTPLKASNLNKVIDYQSESKFIYYTNENSDYEKWADVILSGDIATYDPASYEGLKVYSHETQEAKTGHQKEDTTYEWVDLISPYKKLLKIIAFTKITLQYTNSITSETEYLSFDIGNEDKVFSIDQIITGLTDYQASVGYDIYLYNHLSYGDYAEIKIARQGADTAWMTGNVDTSSPSGYKVVSLRKIGGFKTDASTYIDETSVWDLSTYRKEISSESYKIMVNSELRQLRAEDLPIVDDEAIFTANEVEGALREGKILLNQVKDDSYTVNKFGVELNFSPYKKDTTLVEVGLNEISLRIKKGYIDVFGVRVTLTEDIYLASSDISIKVNDNVYATGRTLGDQTLGKVYEGTWRVFINQLGQIILKENSITRPQFLFSGKLKGWYNSADGSRCIGKFVVRKSGGLNYYIEKLSVTDTFDENIPTNTILVFHGTVCPDGLLPCDGKWHDVNGIDDNAYTSMPETSLWQTGSWYEETPNMWSKGIKMPSSNTFSLDKFEIDVSRNVIQGGSEDCGVEGGSELHSHEYNHTHDPGSLRVEAVDGAHSHQVDSDEFLGESTPIAQVQDATGGFFVAARDHIHNMLIGGGDHGHTTLSGTVETLTSAVTENTSSWAPYKEILYCIKK